MERHLDDDERRILAALGRGPDARSTDIASGRGVPAWIAATLGFCSRCGEELAFGPLPEGTGTALPAPPAATSPTSTRALS
jgi:hypothetical protein